MVSKNEILNLDQNIMKHLKVIQIFLLQPKAI